jgi:hypothetical protein
MAQCPGMNPRYWTPKDIAEVKCPACGRMVEIWKDDIKRKCPQCKSIVPNPRLKKSCLSWCEKAKECLGKEAGEDNI